MITLQEDVHDSYLEVALPAFLTAFRTHYKTFVHDSTERAHLEELLARLEHWNCDYTVESPEAAIMLAWEYHLHLSLF